MKIYNKKQIAMLKGWSLYQIDTWLHAGLLPKPALPGIGLRCFWTEEQVEDMIQPTCKNLKKAWKFHLESVVDPMYAAKYKGSLHKFEPVNPLAVLESDCATDKKPLKGKKSGCTADKKQKKNKSEKKSCVSGEESA